MSDRALNIVLVDDDDVDVMNVQRAFTKGQLPHPTWVAQDGIAALALLRSGEVPLARRLVLLDLNMPRMNGIEFLRELRADPELRMTPVVVLSTSNDERDKTAAYELNVAGYLLKPVTFSAFVELISTLHHWWSIVEFPPAQAD
jgi:CheY-like chemotaxis protein